jgi:hypothetical protein
LQIHIDNKQSYSAMKKHILALAALCALIVSSCGNSARRAVADNTPEQVVTEYYTAVQANDFPKALSLSNISEEERDLVSEILDSTQVVVHNFKVLGSTIDPDGTTALVDLHLVTSHALHPDSISDDIKVPCVISDGKWVVKML